MFKKNLTALVCMAIFGLTNVFACHQKAGTLEIAHPVFRALNGAANGSAYMTITQTGDVSDKLVSASCPFSETMELHDHIEDPINHAKKMVSVKELLIPSKNEGCNWLTCFFAKPEPVKLEKGGKHLMLMKLKPEAVGQKEIDITLVFEKAGKVVVKFKAENLEGGEHACCNHHHGNHHHDAHHKH